MTTAKALWLLEFVEPDMFVFWPRTELDVDSDLLDRVKESGAWPSGSFRIRAHECSGNIPAAIPLEKVGKLLTRDELREVIGLHPLESPVH